MSTNQANFPIATMARVLGVSKAGFYAWRDRPPSAHAQADAALLARVRTVHASSRQTYGAPRVHADLRQRGERHGRKRIARLMRGVGLAGASHRHGGPTTTRRDHDARPAPDLVDRSFTASGPNQLWVADITYVPTAAGFLYLGSGLIDPEDDDGGQGDGGHEGMGASVIAGVDAAPIFEAAEHVLDPVALPVECRVVRYRDLSVLA